ncbi:MAG: hypothetical protein KDD53_11385, partial [Bdellovibrionales bacterium]|nr:hypothetical protein [Bdellovibrionales bacterium]
GIRRIEGKFSTGAVVNIISLEGTMIGRGLVYYSSEEIGKIRGKRSSEIGSILGGKVYEEVIHRDNLYIIQDTEK